MKQPVLRELILYLFLTLFLALWMHWDAWKSHPVEHLQAISTAPLGWLHPFIFAFVVYLIIGVLRLFIAFVRRLKAR